MMAATAKGRIKGAEVVSYIRCMFIPSLNDEIVAKVQSLESYFGVQISFTEKDLPIIGLFQAILNIGHDIIFSRINDFCSICSRTGVIFSSSSSPPEWYFTDLSQPDRPPVQLLHSDSMALERHFLYGGISVNLSGEEYVIDFKEMKLKSLSGKAASLVRFPSFDGIPQRKVKMGIRGDLTKFREVQVAVEKVFDESYVTASPIEISSPLMDSQELIKNIVRQFCVDYEFTGGRNHLLFIKGAPGYVKIVHKKVHDQLLLLKKWVDASITPVVMPKLNYTIISTPSQSSKVPNSSLSTKHPVSMSSSSPSFIFSPHAQILLPNISKSPRKPSRSSSSNPNSSAASLTVGELSNTSFNPVFRPDEPVSKPIAIQSSISPPSPQRSPTLKPTFIESGSVPPLWEPQTDKCVFCNVSFGSQEWNAVHKLAAKTLPSINLEKVERIQNIVLWEKYGLEGKHMKERNSGQINERYLFHGTSKVDPHEVAKADSGIDFRYSKTNRESLMWGNGSYFAVNLSYSDHYSYKCPINRRQVMLVSVLTGYSCSFGTTTSRELTKPPAYPWATGKRLYDTVNGETGGSLVYIVYDHCKTCPAYVITYTE